MNLLDLVVPERVILYQPSQTGQILPGILRCDIPGRHDQISVVGGFRHLPARTVQIVILSVGRHDMQYRKTLLDAHTYLPAGRLIACYVLDIRILPQSLFYPAQHHLVHFLSRRVAFAAFQQPQHFSRLDETGPQTVFDHNLHAIAHKPFLGFVQHRDCCDKIAKQSHQKQYNGQLLNHLSSNTSVICGA